MTPSRFPRSNISPLWLFVLLAGLTPYRAHAQTAVDPNQWYRLSNSFLGENRVLEVSLAKDNHSIMSKKRQSPGQFWRLRETGEAGWYRLYNRRVGDRSALGADPDGNGVVMIALSADTSAPGPRWQLVPLDDGFYRLTTETLGDGFSLDTYSDGTNAPFMGETGDYSGQFWKLTAAELGSSDETGVPDQATQAAGEAPRTLSPADYRTLTRGDAPVDQANAGKHEHGATAIPGQAPGRLPPGNPPGAAAPGPAQGSATIPGARPKDLLVYQGPLPLGSEGTVAYEYYLGPEQPAETRSFLFTADEHHVLAGYLRQYSAQGKPVFEWNWKDGLLDGEQKTYYVDGTPVSVEHFVSGHKRGLSVGYWDNGQKRYEGNLVPDDQLEFVGYDGGDRKEGKWTWWDGEGKVICQHTFANGDCVDCGGRLWVGIATESENLLFYEYSTGALQPEMDLSKLYIQRDDHILNGYLREYNRSGRLVVDQNWKNGIHDGKAVIYHRNGQPCDIEYYVAGVKEGPNISYWENGQKSHSGIYVAGQQDSKWTWWAEDGTVNYERTFKNGACTDCTDEENREQADAVASYARSDSVDAYFAKEAAKHTAQSDSALWALDPVKALAEVGNGRLPERNSLFREPILTLDRLGRTSLTNREIENEEGPPNIEVLWFGDWEFFPYQFKLRNLGSPRTNPGGNGAFREYRLNVLSFARQGVSLEIEDWGQPVTSPDLDVSHVEMNTELTFFPRVVLPGFRYSPDRKTVTVTLPTREEVTFDARTMEITGGVLQELAPIDTSLNRFSRSFAQIGYTGKGMMLRSDQRGASPRDPRDWGGEEKSAVLTWGAKKCRIKNTLLWGEGFGSFLQFETDTAFFQFVKQQCKWDVSAKDFGLETLDEVAPEH